MIINQKIIIKRPPSWIGCPPILQGRVIYQNKHYFTVRTRGGYCECVQVADLVTGQAVIV